MVNNNKDKNGSLKLIEFRSLKFPGYHSYFRKDSEKVLVYHYDLWFVYGFYERSCNTSLITF